MRQVLFLLFLLAVIVGAPLVVRSTFVQEPPAGKGFTKSAEQDLGTYYRLKVNLTYKGEPQDFNIVVGCNVRQINYGDGGRTVEIGLVPTVFGRRMSDGKGLVVRPPRACRGETTENGLVQLDLLPVVVVYDNADILDFGIAYLSEDAYENSLSVLKFGGATIERATRADFEQFRSSQTNLVTRESYRAALTASSISRPFGSTCNAHQRFRIPEEVRPLVSEQWPQERPRYWVPDTLEAEQKIRAAIRRSRNLEPDTTRDRTLPLPKWQTHALSVWQTDVNSADGGLPTRNGGGLVSKGRGHVFPAAYYPSSEDRRTDKWPTDPGERAKHLASLSDFAWASIDYGNGRMLGFGYCFAHITLPGLGQLRGKNVNRVDGQPVEPVISKRFSSGQWIFDRDEYVFHLFRTYLESTRGDV